jgi:hypothetical protein
LESGVSDDEREWNREQGLATVQNAWIKVPSLITGDPEVNRGCHSEPRRPNHGQKNLSKIAEI